MSQQAADTPLDKPCAHEPYPGLRPYEEDEQNQFFGRDADTQILLDKILTHRLTLLFAATGVGKSSLLKAAVIPKLKSASGKHLDVVYYNDWVTSPLKGLKAEIAKTVRNSTNWPLGTQLDESLELPKFVQFCTLFVRPPLVIMLDQFEELFRYRSKYHTDSFRPFIEDLTGLITATRIPVSVVFSMREDFALELNAFKPKLPTLLFENYYRLERLPAKAAQAAIVKPLRPSNFRYEPELLKQLLLDLLKHDPDRDIASLGSDEELETVIPPQLQIVCSQLWEKECGNADRTIHLKVYEQAGRAKGLLKNYVDKALSSKAFNDRDRRVLSRAFDHLVSIQGTKMPHTVATLVEKTGDSEKQLTVLLEKLASQDVRILRSQQREKQTWYELYHDMYSDSINAWNRLQKRKMLWRHVKIWGTTAVIAGSIIFGGTVYIVHSMSYHLRLPPGEDNSVEVFKGKYGWPDLFNQKQFYYETFLQSREIEPDKRFQEKGLLDYTDINTDLIGYQPLEERITAYIQDGNFGKAEELFDKTVKSSSGKQASDVVRGLFSMKNQRSFQKIQQLAASEKNASVNKMALTLFEENTTILFLESLDELRIYQQFLKEQSRAYSISVDHVKSSPLLFYKVLAYLSNDNDTIRAQAAIALGLIGDRAVVEPLVKVLGDDNESVRGSAAEALGRIGDRVAVEPLVRALGDDNESVQQSAVEALGLIGDRVAVEPLVRALGDDNESVQQSAVEALGLIGDRVVVEPLVKALGDDNKYARGNAAEALGRIGDRVAVEPLVKALGDDNESVRGSAAEALGRIGDRVAVEPLVKALGDDNEDVRLNAAEALGRIGDRVAVEPLVKALGDDDEFVRRYAAEALGRIGDRVAVGSLVKALGDDNEYVRLYAAEALGRIGDRFSVEPLVKALGNDNEYVRGNAAEALGLIGDRVAVEPLVKVLGDDNEYVRQYAAEALGRIGDRVAVESLVKALGDDDEYVRGNAAEALGRIDYLSKIKFKKPMVDEKKAKSSTDKYRWMDFFDVTSFIGSLEEVSGFAENRRQLLAALNLPVSSERDQALLQLAGDTEIHLSIREKAITVLGEEGKDKKHIVSVLQALNPPPASLKQAINTAMEHLSKEVQTKSADKVFTKNEITQLQTQLEALKEQYVGWRIFRDSKKSEDFAKAEDYDKFLAEVREKKAEMNPNTAFDYAYDLAYVDSEIGIELLDHPIARARQGAYTAIMMKANIEQLIKLDRLREKQRDNPIFRHAAFRAIDMGLQRLEVLGNHNNGDQELHELEAWQKKLEADQNRRIVMKRADDTVDEVLERLQWTTMMMKHTKKMTAKFEKDGWVRDWPKNTLPVNQPYPEISQTP